MNLTSWQRWSDSELTRKKIRTQLLQPAEALVEALLHGLQALIQLGDGERSGSGRGLRSRYGSGAGLEGLSGAMMPFEGRHLAMIRDMRQHCPAPFPLDLLVRRPEEVEIRYRGGDPVVRAAVDHGEVLHG